MSYTFSRFLSFVFGTKLSREKTLPLSVTALPVNKVRTKIWLVYKLHNLIASYVTKGYMEQAWLRFHVLKVRFCKHQ